MYKIIMMSGQIYLVNKSEYLSIMKAEKGIFVPRLEVFINKSSVSTAYPENRADEIEDRRQQMTGVLSDGTFVKRHFGSWVIANKDVPDDKGNYSPVRINPEYYPEVARDCVMTEIEYEKFKTLSDIEQIKFLSNMGSLETKRQSTEGLTKLFN